MKKFIFLLVILFNYSAFAWSFGDTESYACFRENSKSPIKVTIYDKGELQITWDEYPVEYHFMSLHNNKILAGSVWQVMGKEMDINLERFLQNDTPDKNWIQTGIVVFDLKTKQLAYGEVENPVRVKMNCINL